MHAGTISYRPLVRSGREKLSILQLSPCFSRRPVSQHWFEPVSVIYYSLDEISTPLKLAEMNNGKACNLTPAVALDKYDGESSCSATIGKDSLQICVVQHEAVNLLGENFTWYTPSGLVNNNDLKGQEETKVLSNDVRQLDDEVPNWLCARDLPFKFRTKCTQHCTQLGYVWKHSLVRSCLQMNLKLFAEVFSRF